MIGLEQHIALDRVILDEVGASPERLASAIHNQLGNRPGPVPVHAIARALDIDYIREEPLRGMEAALVTTPERGYGAIVVNCASSFARRRFSIGHELGHFLNPHHETTTDGGFECTRVDMGLSQTSWDPERSRHQVQEIEANRFAIELLAPPGKLRRFLEHEPDLRYPLAIAEELKISREAAVRRYVALHRARLAVVFSCHDRFTYADPAPGFPSLVLRRDDPMPNLPGSRNGSPLSAMAVTDHGDWLAGPRGQQLHAQTLFQRDGYRTILLVAETDRDDEGEGKQEESSFADIGRLRQRKRQA